MVNEVVKCFAITVSLSLKKHFGFVKVQGAYSMLIYHFIVAYFLIA